MELRTEALTEDARAAILAARDRLLSLGHGDARVDEDRESGFDLVASDVVARIDWDRTDLDAVRDLAGDAAAIGKTACLFSAGGFSDETVAWADRAGVGLFLYDRYGRPQPVGRTAADAVARSVTQTPAFGTGDMAEPGAVAVVLAEGLLGGPVGEVSLWFGGAGQVLTFWLEPGDRHTPASVLMNLYPWALGAPPDGLDDGWERAHRDVAGGGREQVWVRECQHANQPPTAVASEALAHAIAALGACGVEMERCHVELRPAPSRTQLVREEAVRARGSTLGPVGHFRLPDAPPAERTDAARIINTLTDRAHEGGRVRKVDVVGIDGGGGAAWRLMASPDGSRGGQAQWVVEARLPKALLAPDGPRLPFVHATATVGGTRWRLDGDEWRVQAEGGELEGVANQALADIAAAFALAHEPFEQTLFRVDS